MREMVMWAVVAAGASLAFALIGRMTLRRRLRDASTVIIFEAC